MYFHYYQVILMLTEVLELPGMGPQVPSLDAWPGRELAAGSPK